MFKETRRDIYGTAGALTLTCGYLMPSNPQKESNSNHGKSVFDSFINRHTAKCQGSFSVKIGG